MVCGAMLFLSLLACQPPAASAPPPPVVAEAPPPVPAWPEPGTPLTELVPADNPLDRQIRVYLDPGHGTGTNSGNNGVRCHDEQDATLEQVDDLQTRLEDLGFEVRSGRPQGTRPSYSTRVARANAWPADVFLSLHTDARGLATVWKPVPGWTCHRNDDQPGFAILVSDEGTDAVVESRAKLAYSITRRMNEAGFYPFDGVDYGSLYDYGLVEGSFLDRRGLLMLRRPKMPSVIIESHHAYDLEEVRRFDEEGTKQAFAMAVAAAVVDSVTE